MAEPRRILLVCTGNLCRSPMAAGLLRHRLKTAGLDESYEIRSAGTRGVTGRLASAYARQVMADRGIDITRHRAREIDGKTVEQADLILVMTKAHREAILAEFPEARSRTYLLSEMIGKHYDIADPYGASLTHYEYCAEDLSSIIESGFEHILGLAGEDP